MRFTKLQITCALTMSIGGIDGWCVSILVQESGNCTYAPKLSTRLLQRTKLMWVVFLGSI